MEIPVRTRFATECFASTRISETEEDKLHMIFRLSYFSIPIVCVRDLGHDAGRRAASSTQQVQKVSSLNKRNILFFLM